MDAVDRGLPQAEVASLFRVSVRSIKRWRHRQRERGHLAVSPRPGRTARKLAALRAGLLPHLEAHPDATLEELCEWWEQTQRVRVSQATMSRVITRHFGWTRKKSHAERRSATRPSEKPGASRREESIRVGSSGSTRPGATVA